MVGGLPNTHTQPTKPKHAESTKQNQQRPALRLADSVKKRPSYKDKTYQLHQTFHLYLIQPADSDVSANRRGNTHPGGAADGD